MKEKAKVKYGCAMLAGGRGSRMGNVNKAELEYGSMTFAGRIAEEMEKTGFPCYMSSASYEQKIPKGWKHVKDCVADEYGRYIGPMGGIYSCLREAAADGLEGLFFAPCDAPFYTVDAIDKLINLIGKDNHAAFWKSADGRIQTTFGWYSVRCLDRMEEDINRGLYKLVCLIDELSCKVVETDGYALDSAVFRNINDMDEYMKLRNTENEPVSLEYAVTALAGNSSLITSCEEVSLYDSLGRTLAEDITAVMDQPPFPRSPLDGYAVRACDTYGASHDTPKELKVICEVDAGHSFSGTVGPGEAVRIMTGAPIPDGADAVIGQEDTDYGEVSVNVFEELQPFQNYCESGEDYRKGDVLLREREHIGAVESSIIASAGKNSVRVYKRPKALVISTGDEVVLPGEELSAGKIYDSNLFMVTSLLREWEVQISDAVQSGDDPENLRDIIDREIDDADIVITTGGVSVGKKDILHETFRMMSIEKLFWRISIKPGMAMMSGKYRGKLILSLSGNPYAAYTDMHMAVRPVIDAMNGNSHLSMQRTEAVLMSDYNKKSYVRRFIRAYVSDGRAFIEGHTGGNGTVYAGRGTNALIDIPAGTTGLSAGDKVSVLLI